MMSGNSNAASQTPQQQPGQQDACLQRTLCMLSWLCFPNTEAEGECDVLRPVEKLCLAVARHLAQGLAAYQMYAHPDLQCKVYSCGV